MTLARRGKQHQSSWRRASYVHTDVSKAVDVQKMVAVGLERFGKLDIAVNNAGIKGEGGKIDRINEDDFDRIIAINLKGVYLDMKYDIPVLTDRQGTIVNVSSIAGLVGFENNAAYVASKHGVVGLTKAAALEFAKQGLGGSMCDLDTDGRAGCLAPLRKCRSVRNHVANRACRTA